MMYVPVDETRQHLMTSRIDHQIGGPGRKRFGDVDDAIFYESDVAFPNQLHGVCVEQVSVQDIDDHMASSTSGPDSPTLRQE